METREFPTAVIASISSGVLLCEFSKMHEASEYLMGYPIWTHHFASKDLWQSMRQKILEQCPGMPVELSGVTADNYLERVSEIEKEIGATVVIRKGNGETPMHPLDGISDGNPTVIIRT